MEKLMLDSGEAIEMSTIQKIAETVKEILREADMDLMTEFKLRLAASAKLGFDLSGPNHKKIVRDVLETFLLSNPSDGEAPVRDTVAPALKKRVAVAATNLQDQRFICKLSEMENLTVEKYKGRAFMSIGKETVYRFKGMHFSVPQWSIMKKHFEAVEEAIECFQSKPRSESAKKGDNSDSMYNNNTGAFFPTRTSYFDGKSLFAKEKDTSEAVDNNSTGVFVPVENSHLDGESLSAKDGDTSEAVDNNSSGGFVPIEISRFDGKNYLGWASQMELFLKQLNLSYVLSEPCPSTTSSQETGTYRIEITQADAAGKNWLRDDYLCHNHLLNSLSDHLHRQYLKKFKHAKELWDELKWVYYMCEESNSKRLQVRKYIEFNMVEGRSVLKQVQDFNKIAESIVSAGMFLDETFHVSTIISKFPSSWRGFCTRLMEEEFLPVWMLMERVKAEDEIRRNRAQGVMYRPATGSSQMEKRPSLGTTHSGSQSIGLKRKESERDGNVIIARDNCEKDRHLAKNCWGEKPDERAFRKPDQVTSSVTAPLVSETPDTTNSDKEL